MAQGAYEAMVILNPNVAEEDLAAATQRISDQITARGGQVDKVDIWGRRRMLYSIKKLREGQYVVYTFRSDPQAIRELESTWRITDEVLRHLVTRQLEKGKASGAASTDGQVPQPAPAGS